ncbi:MAG: transketolase [Pseudomonadota bacterium]
MADAIRVLAMDAVQAANSGHPGMPMGMADAATVLFTKALRFDAADPAWPNRDRFVLSAGHGSMLLYALLYLTGTTGMERGDLEAFRQLGSKTAGHPEYGHAPGIETTTGPLGQGIANAVGMALAERVLRERHGTDVVDHHTYCIAGDGCLMEGISQEAISLAGHLKLSRLIVLFDDNAISIDGSTDLSTSDDQIARFSASGWHTERVDGHDHDAVEAALNAAKASDRPTLIACKTTIGYGAPTLQGTAKTHGSPLGADEIAATREALAWDAAPFDVPSDVLDAWRAAGSRGGDDRKRWDESHAKARASLTDPLGDEAQASALAQAFKDVKAGFLSEQPKLATRQSSQKVLEAIVPAMPALLGGSADLTGSNGTLTSHHKPLRPDDFSGSYVHYGVREHAMAAAMNGIALHGGLVPYGATFLVFTDYCRPSIRLSALMGQRVIYVMTHDSIGLGEDGPTHQPVEHLAALRAMPNLNVFRPADAVEAAEAWALALASSTTPSILALSRQGLPALDRGGLAEPTANASAQGGYVLQGGEDRAVTLIATGSEVELAIEAARQLSEQGVKAAVVSMPCLDLFLAQEVSARAHVLGEAPRVIIEAGVQQSWDRLMRDGDRFIGMSGFGASAPAGELYKHFGITSDAVVAAAKAALT